MSKNAEWDARHSSEYEGKRFVVDGDLIELHAYEYGVSQHDVAENFHAELLEECESRWLDRWVRHHDRMLRQTCDALEAENDKLRDLIYNIIVDEERGHNDDRTFFEHVVRAHEYGIAQDVEVGQVDG